MPKHNIYPATTADIPADRRLELHWQRESGVQLATTVWKGPFGSTPDTGLEFLPGATGTAEDPGRAWDGQFLDLNRDQLNHLIKQLRVARDQAFGRDE